MECRTIQRVVLWSDGSGQSEVAEWAAWYAAQRRLPLHVLHVPCVVAPALAGPSRGAGFAAGGESALDAVDLARSVHRLRARHRHLPVTLQFVRDRPADLHDLLLGPGSLLVTGARSLETVPRSGAPVVIVPEGGTGRGAQGGRHDRSGHSILLLLGRRPSPRAAAFAFAAADGLGVPLDVVRPASQTDAYGEDYWVDSGPGPTATAGPGLEAGLSRLTARFPHVPVSGAALRDRPPHTLHARAGAACLAVLGVEPGVGTDLRTLLDLGDCPVALVPEVGAHGEAAG
jgi:hypothetical protein